MSLTSLPMTELRRVSLLSAVLLAVLPVSCSHGGGAGSVGLRTYPDAVVNINQVDPAYRAYFRSQHAANYDLSEQRAAFAAANKTARTPVPKSVPNTRVASSEKKTTPRRKALASGKKKGGVVKGKRKSSANKRIAQRKPTRNTSRKRRR